MIDESNNFNDRESVDEKMSLLNNSVRPAVAIPVMIDSPMDSMNNIEEFNFNFTPDNASRQLSATKGLPRPFDISLVQTPLIYKTFKQNLN